MSKTKAMKKAGSGFLLPVATAAAGGIAANQFPQNRHDSKTRKKVAGELKKMAYPFDNEGPDFNHKAARAIYDIIAKMDDDSAQAFAEIVISDVLEAEIEKNLPIYQKRLDEVIEKRTRALRKEIMKRADDPNAKGYAEAMGMIAKYDWDENLHPRNRSGQFRTTIKHSQKKPLHDKTAAALGVGGTDKKPYQKLTPAQKAQYQDEYRQIAQFLDTLHHSTGGSGNYEVAYHVQDKTGNSYLERRPGGGVPKDILLDPDTKIVGVQGHPTTLNAGGAAFGLVPALGDGSVKGINAVDQNFGSFANSWVGAGDPTGQNRNQQRYDRMAAGSNLLSQVGNATGNKNLMIAGQVGQFVGSHGAEAEAVIGPSARKTAYRYRGTERTPDPKVIRRYAEAVRAAKQNTSEEAAAGRSGRTQTPPAPSQMARQRVLNEGRAPSKAEIDYGVGAVGNYLKTQRVPSKNLYGLQLASGNTPPSEGVMFDSKGQIVAQAVGYGDDHYLPFNLKNLKSLKGGQYVRTRSVGGPTSEDIYTGLVAGARRVTVVSRSGTFSVEFQDDFRGGRRHNDKARRMTQRYQQLLDAVQSEQVDKESIPQEVRQDIEDQVRSEAADWGDPPAVVRQKIATKIREYKENPDLTPRERAVLESRWRAATNNGESRDAKRVRAEIFGHAMAAKEYRYKLNGHGYEAALDALEEQFPYYIHTHSNADPEIDTFNPTVDRGYVEPGRNRPTAARAGLYGVRGHTQSTKHSAADADYQGVHSVRRGGSANIPAGDRTTQDTEGETTTEPTAAPSTKTGEIKRKIAVANSVVALQESLRDRRDQGLLEFPPGDNRGEILDLPATELTKPENIGKFDAFLRSYSEQGGQVDPKLRVAYENAVGNQGRVEYDRNAPTWSKKANTFDKGKGAYDPDAPFNEKLEEMKKRDAFSALSDKKFSGMSEPEQEAEHTLLVELLAHAKTYPGPISGEIKRDYGATKGAPGLAGLDSAGEISQRLENLHRVRALKSDMAEEERGRAAAMLAPGAVVLTPPLETPQERAEGGPMVETGKLIRNLEEAAKQYEASGDPDEEEMGSDLRVFAQAVKDQRHDFRSVEDVKRVQDDNKDLMVQMYQGLARKKQQ